MSPGHVGGGLVAGGGRAHGEALGVHGALAEQQLPVGRAGGHIEGGGDEKDLRAGEGHQVGQLGEAEVEADAQTHSAPGSVEHGDLRAGGEGGGFPEGLAAGYVDVEEVQLAVAGCAAAGGVEDIGGVIHLAVGQLRHRAAHQPQALFPGQGGEKLVRFAAGGFAVGAEAAVVVGAAEHLRQDGHIRRAGLLQQGGGAAEVLRLVGGDVHLNLSDLHSQNSLSTRSVTPSWMVTRRLTWPRWV